MKELENQYAVQQMV